jgi:hypothetical protein
MADFHIGIVGKAEEEIVDKQVLKKISKFVADLKALGVEFETAHMNSGHFLGGAKNLIDEPAEVVEPVAES